jgi:hypothetical protein
MRAAPERPAFYALGGGRVGELLTLLHPPYTAWHLSYFALGAAAAPHLYVNRLLWGLAAFALAVGVAAHALDELHDRPLATGLSDRALIALATVSLLGALAIGVAGAISVSALLVPLVVLGGLFLPAYNLEWAGGRLHSDLWFAIGWGAFPAFTGYFSNALAIRPAGLLVSAGCCLLSVAQRRLSTPVRELRRQTVGLTGEQRLRDGRVLPVNSDTVRAPLEGALSALWPAVVLLAAGAVAVRL